jgi:hypothetical protein
MSAKPIPEGYTSVMPYLTADDGKGAISGLTGTGFPVRAAIMDLAAVAFFVCS